MKLKLDLHPIYSDSRSIETALNDIIDEAVAKHASEIEIIPGKGSGALKKSVIRFLDRPEVKVRYHRIEKDSDNWGRLFVHFRHEREEPNSKSKPPPPRPTIPVGCACCIEPINALVPDEDAPQTFTVECPWCGSPNRINIWRDRRRQIHAKSVLDY